MNWITGTAVVICDPKPPMMMIAKPCIPTVPITPISITIKPVRGIDAFTAFVKPPRQVYTVIRNLGCKD